MSDAVQRKEQQKWAAEKPKLDNARRLRGIYFIDPADAEFKETTKNTWSKWNFRCQQLCLTRSGKTKYACIVEVNDSTIIEIMKTQISEIQRSSGTPM